MVEQAVRIVYAYVYAPLRNQEFTSLKALNNGMHQQLLLLNNKPCKNTVYSRLYFYEQQERAPAKTIAPRAFCA